MDRFRILPARLALAAVICLGALATSSSLAAQTTSFNDSLLGRVRALAATTAGERPQSVHVMKIVESAGPLSSYVAGADSTRVPSCFPVFQIRYRDRWIVVDAAVDSQAIAESYGARGQAGFHRDRYLRLETALRGAEHVVLTHEHFDHAVGVERGPYFATIAAKTLLSEEQLQSLLDPKARGIVRLTRDSAAAFPVLRYGLLYLLAPGVVLIKAPGHTPGSQFVYVQLASGKEVLIAGDLAWQHEGLTENQQKPEATSRSLSEDRAALEPQLEWARKLWRGGEVAIVLSHDSRLLDSLVASGVLVNDFDLGPH
ncbi:MAG: MBL fold metallo-hydrolase [Gemmatimonadales bacterium]|jgi:glyoxylase-like metal-dependent hydrolase (beta-lactamase superfamily II)